MKWRKLLLCYVVTVLTTVALLMTLTSMSAAQTDTEIPADLQGLLGWLLTGGGFALVAYWIIEHWAWWPWFPRWQPEPKRWAAMGWVLVLTVPAVLLQVWFGFRQELPPDIQAWVKIVLAAWGPLFLANQLLHARLKAYWAQSGG